MWEKLSKLWKSKDIRRKIFFIFGLLVVFRLAAHIPIPGVDVQNLRNFFSSNEFLGLLNVFSGGAMENFSIVMVGVAPYITASIIFQLLTMIVPRLEELSKEPQGYQKINQYTRWATVPLAILQAYGTITLLQRSGQGIIGSMDIWQWIVAVGSITGGSIMVMWLGELISEKQIGNGISLIIFAGIVARIPVAIQQVFATFDPTKLPLVIAFVAVAIVTIIGVVYITEAQRNVPVQYARQIRGNRVYGGMSTHLPLRVNQAGVIPIIFAISLVMIPPLLGQMLTGVGNYWVDKTAQTLVQVFNNQIFYAVFYFVLVVAFSYFYTAVIFHPDQISENLQKRGGFIPGIRPGRSTAIYLQKVSQRILLAGSLFLGSIAILPLILKGIGGGGFAAMAIGGTSLLIVVSVAIETVKQLESQLTARDYDSF